MLTSRELERPKQNQDRIFVYRTAYAYLLAVLVIKRRKLIRAPWVYERKDQCEGSSDVLPLSLSLSGTSSSPLVEFVASIFVYISGWPD
ncbi:hypothetical protein GWI33_020104 [Rhynchophorus ferrugineus]|uniref:Uncharacterized protein n=1 Tax=Rhynchophorus ferrugineus TaxID=354439 RepID=A0A834HUZ5_RHYFE|nr:hypothetical protein GWI33_020104 [Rhynchophorus ferrugineus]